MRAYQDGLFIRSSNNEKVPVDYILLIELTEANPINVGNLGIHIFEPGYYLYTGSALNGLVSRISRHIRSDKPYHWHIRLPNSSWTLQRDILDCRKRKNECRWSRQISSSKASTSPMRGFGSLDCKRRDAFIFVFTFIESLPNDKRNKSQILSKIRIAVQS